MGKAKQVTPRKRAVVAQYVKDGVQQKDICAQLNLKQSTVSKLVRKLKMTGRGSICAGKSSGRSRITSVRDDAAIRLCY
jgi:transposase